MSGEAGSISSKFSKWIILIMIMMIMIMMIMIMIPAWPAVWTTECPDESEGDIRPTGC